MNVKSKLLNRNRRSARVRAKILGTAERPRLAVHRSLRYTSAQIIDDSAGKTLVSAHSREAGKNLKKLDAAFKVGEMLAERAKKAGIERVVFDRSYYKFHGRIKSLADAARKKGLQF